MPTTVTPDLELGSPVAAGEAAADAVAAGPPAKTALIERLRAAAEVLEEIERDRGLLAPVPESDRVRLLRAARLVSNPDNRARRRLVKATARQRRHAEVKKEEDVLASTGIRALRRRPVYTSPNVFPPTGFVDGEPVTEPATPALAGTTDESRHCYVCKQHYVDVHHFYDQLCPGCGEFNFRKRSELADLRGRVALLTGGRVTIGYEAGLKLLRAGAELIVTTRFPRDSAKRYSEESDFSEWGHRLQVYGLDLRHTPSVEAFCSELLRTRSRLDFIVNNACQTVRRPPGFYEHMMEGETAALHTMPEHQRQLVGHYEGLRGYSLLPEANHASGDARTTRRQVTQRLAEVTGL